MSLKEVLQRPFFLPFIALIVGIFIWDLCKSPLQIPDSFPHKKEFYTGCLVSDPNHRETNTQLELALRPNPLQIRLSFPKPKNRADQDFLKKGDCVEFQATLKAPTSFRNPGFFDYQKFLHRKGMVATAFVADFKLLKRVSEAKPSLIQSKLPEFKTQLVAKIHELGFSSQAEAVLAALLWGEERNLSEKTWDLFRDQGLAHLLVISGLHFTLLAWMTYRLSLWILRFYPQMFLTIPGPKLASLFTLFFSTLYFLFCEPNPSITRAYLGIVVFLITLWINRPRDLPNTLFLAAFLILVLNPNDLFNASFQFSFVAVASLIFILPQLERLIPLEKIHSIPRGFLKLLLTNLALSLGLLPILVFYFYEIQANGFWMNLWAVFYVEFFLVPIGLMALAVSLISFSAGQLLFSVPLAGIEFLLQILEWSHSHFPKPFLVFPPHLWQLGVYYFALVVLIFKGSRLTKITTAMLCFIAWILGYADSNYQHQTHSDLIITQLDVGQGDAILIQTPGPHWVLIDTGGSPYFEIGERVILPYLLHARIPKLDAIFITHADTDHYLGLESLLPFYAIDQIFWNGVPNAEMDLIWQEVSKRQIPLKSFQAGSLYSITENISIKSLWPKEPLDSKDNNQSLVLRLDAKLSQGSMSALFTGDLEERAERTLLENPEIDVDYLKIGHHGSKTSSSWEFLKATSPQIATLGAGIANRYGHPHRLVLQALKDAQIPTYSTQENGAIQTIWDGNHFQIETFISPASEINLETTNRVAP